MSKAKSRAALLRLRQWKVDEIRKEIGALETLRQQLVEKAAGLEAQVIAERVGASGDALAQLSYGGFAQKVIADRARIAQEMMELDGCIAQVRERLREAFLDLKQLEIVERGRREREAAAQAQAEAHALDETALNGFIRKNR